MSDSVRPHRQQPTRLPHLWDSPDKNTGVGWHFLLQYRKVKSESDVAQSYPTLCDPMDCSLPGSSIHGIFQARIPEWAAIYGVAQSRTRLSDFTFTFHFHHWRRKWHPTPVLLPGKSHGWRSLVDCSPWGFKELDMTEQLTHTHALQNGCHNPYLKWLYVCVCVVWWEG